MASISYRQSIRWLPELASEPTETIVLTGLKTGVFLDVRFSKATRQLDWAFAGFRTTEPPNVTRFEHHIDSRTLMPLDVVDVGYNQTMPDGSTLESGEMVNPATGLLTPYEEVWRDEERERGLFIRRRTEDEDIWRGWVGELQMAMGRARSGGQFWAWTALRENGQWRKVMSTEKVPDCHYADGFLEDGDELAAAGWQVLER